MSLARGSRLSRTFFVAAGSVFLATGMVGILVPVLPTTPFLILAALCYARGSERCYKWLTTNRVFGRYLGDYLCGRGVPAKVKAAALIFLWAVITVSAVFFVEQLWLRLVLFAVAVSVTVHVLLLRGRVPGG